MKLLMIYTHRFWYKPNIKTINSAPEAAERKEYNKVQTAFIQVEKEDEEKENEVIKKLIKNLKWVAGKNETKHIILHSFAHLSESKAGPEFTKSLFDKAEERLVNTGYTVNQTPFGYFLDLSLDAPGFSLARVFKEF
ncbi:MAG: threonyl-tRNA synthetase editing domain-containing protein [Bacteroidales bacterium]